MPQGQGLRDSCRTPTGFSATVCKTNTSRRICGQFKLILCFLSTHLRDECDAAHAPSMCFQPALHVPVYVPATNRDRRPIQQRGLLAVHKLAQSPADARGPHPALSPVYRVDHHPVDAVQASVPVDYLADEKQRHQCCAPACLSLKARRCRMAAATSALSVTKGSAACGPWRLLLGIVLQSPKQ